MSETGPPLLEFIGVSLRRHREWLLSQVSFAVRPHTIHVIVGPNGAGKTTLLGALLGQAAFEGRIVAHWRAGGQIGFVPQLFTVDSSLPVTVEDFLALTRQRLPVCFGVRRGTRQRVAALLREVGLAGLEHRPLSVLSGGELRRVLLAHSLDPVPELLILDEPAAGLDESGVSQLEELLRTLKAGGTTVLMVSHDLDQVRRLADWVTVLDRSVVGEGPAADTLALERVVALLPSGAAQAREGRRHRESH
ncbi:MAG: metal ABC transporter ATP-binding protein [Vicinamibacterales bacterium]